MNKVIYSSLLVVGVLISAFAQVLLKKSALKPHRDFSSRYLNVNVISAYIIFFIAIFCTVIAYKSVPLSLGPVLASSEYLFVAILDRIFFFKKTTFLVRAGLFTIVIGVLISAF